MTKDWMIENRASILLLGVLLFAPHLIAQKQRPAVSMDPLDHLSASLAQMVAKVAPAIVRVEAVGYSESNQDDEHRFSDHKLQQIAR